MISANSMYPQQFKIYVPGLISLFLILPLSMFQLDKYQAFEKTRVLEVNWVDPNLVNTRAIDFPPVRNYLVIKVTGNRKEDKIKFDFAQLVIREIMAKYDTTKGVRIHFTDSARYESFVRALDVCHREVLLTYAPHKNDLWIFNRIRNVEERRMFQIVCGISFFTGNAVGNEGRTFAFPFAYDFDGRFWPLPVLLIVLTILSFRKST